MQPDTYPQELSEQVEYIMRCAVDLLMRLDTQGVAVRESAKKTYGLLLEAHMLLTGVIQSALLRKNLMPGKTSESTAHRLWLIASFIQGIGLCETAISEGFYFQAAALLRQELETVAAINEVNSGVRMNRRNPNVHHVPWSLGQLYGILSEAAHVSETGILQSLLAMAPQGQAAPVTIEPEFNEVIANKFYGLHVTLLSLLCLALEQLYEDLYGEGLSELESKMLVTAIDFLVKEDALSLAE